MHDLIKTAEAEIIPPILKGLIATSNEDMTERAIREMNDDVKCK